MYVVFHLNFATNIVHQRYNISNVSFLDMFGPIAGVTNPIMKSLLRHIYVIGLVYTSLYCHVLMIILYLFP